MGCFWGAERIFWNLKGVYVTSVGYAGGFTPNPTYEEVCSGKTGHAEVVQVVFDKQNCNYIDLLKLFFESHNPTQGMRQGNDRGTQYRSIILYENEQQKEQESLGTAESGDTEDFSLNDLVGGKEGQEGEEESDDADQPATPQQRPTQEPADLDTPSYEQENEETQQRQGGESSESLTAQNLESALKDMMQQKDSGYQPVYMEIDNIDINQVVAVSYTHLTLPTKA